ncbi:response regulator transcription factor [Sporosarcina oncorhynchi]|uniref:Response regulator transcription factor n=1 Tax=Sporosarcina oncorhynchi TaxID=3056444 RepID=A0ABZ0LAR8_9BACL|nr:response regulator transcription factor [Sporosarcina sp. T2O-4]WOV89255.1 response regulator transcription factor [Sporosarcina sp. T2O-4]
MQEKKRILIIEDDPEINKLLRIMLTDKTVETVQAYSGTEGLLQLQMDRFDLILLDLMLPGKSGEELIGEIRQQNAIPIIVISAKTDVNHKVSVLKMGADDYITKPFHQQEVAARVDVQLRKVGQSSRQPVELVWQDLQLHTEKRSVCLSGHMLQMTNAEFDILLVLMRQPERAFSKREIYESIWKDTYYGDDNTISVHMSNLRRKMAEHTSRDYIKTVWGVGFMLV